MDKVTSWYLVKHLVFPIIDCDCMDTIKSIYESMDIVTYRKLYHKHIYKWGYGKPNSIACNNIRNKLMNIWFNIDIYNHGAYIWWDYRKGISDWLHNILLEHNYIPHPNTIYYKYIRMYKIDII